MLPLTLVLTAILSQPPLCLERSYDKAHLAKHPGQPVTRIRLARVDEDAWGISLWLRERTKPVLLQQAVAGEDGPLRQLLPSRGSWLAKLRNVQQDRHGAKADIPADVYRVERCRGVDEIMAHLRTQCERPACGLFLLRFAWEDTPLTENGDLWQENGGIVPLRATVSPVQSRSVQNALLGVPVEMNTCMTASFANAALLGYEDGLPVVDTDKGPMKLHNARLRPGAKDNLRVYRKETLELIERYTLPADLTVGEGFDVSYDQNGQALLLQDGRCVALSESGMFQERPRTACRKTEPLELPPIQREKLGVTPHVSRTLWIPGTSFFVVYSMGVVC